MMTVEEAHANIENENWTMLHYPEVAVCESGPVAIVWIESHGTTVLYSQHVRGEVVASDSDSIHYLPVNNKIGTDKFIRTIGRLIAENPQWVASSTC